MLFTNPKNNPLQTRQTNAYRITGATGGIDARSGLDVQTSKIVWEEEIDITADDALAATCTKKESGQAMFLMDMLANGPVPVKLIEERVAARGFSKDQLIRTRRKMGIVAFKEKTKDGGWFWALPQHAPEGAGE